MHQPLDDLEPLARTYERMAEAMMLSNALYLRQEYTQARDVMVDVVKIAAVLHKRVGTLARVKARG